MLLKNLSFRAKDIITKDWVCGIPLKDGDVPDRWYIMFQYTDGLDKIQVVPESICMYSGHKDRKKNPIYVGDILKIKNSQGVEYLCICWYGDSKRELLGYDGIHRECQITGIYYQVGKKKHTFPVVENYAGVNDTKIMEIVGNVIDNPDLEKKALKQTI
jgi:hypothetical protein